ncbi:MAG: PEGA domain-containing protein [Prolixibacteraceae bacterium]
MKRFSFTLFILIYSILIFAQNISVSSFKVLPRDLDARVNFPVKDQNGDVCALLKIATTESGFNWDGDQLGIVKVEKKTGEYWLYIPFGAKRLTIKHDQLGVLREYRYPEAINKATVYEMVLVSGKVTTSVIPVNPTWVTFKSNPTGADVYINDLLKGVTPLPIKLMPGKYTYRIEKSLYNRSAGSFEITGQEKEGKKEIPVELKPAFGTIRINTIPEQGAMVLIDDIETGKLTPFTDERIKSGSHVVTVKKDFFQPKSIKVQVSDGQITEETISMISSVAKVQVETQPSADIYIDGKFVAKNVYEGNISAGVTTFEARKEGYYTDKQDVDIIAGEAKIITLSVRQIVGNIDVVSTPIEAKIYLDGVPKGITPVTLQNVAIGNHEIKMEMAEYETLVKTIEVAENKTIEVNETLKGIVKEGPKKKAKEKIKPEIPQSITAVPIAKENMKPYSAEYYKYKSAKTAWLVSAIGSTAVGAFAYMQTSSYFKKYQDALSTADATSYSKKSDLYNKISPVAFGVAGFCLVETILKAGQQKKAKNKAVSWYPRPVENGAVLNFVYKF